MASVMNKIAVGTVSQLMEMDSSYLKRFSFVISEPWISTSHPSRLQMSEKDKLSITNDVDEKEYDDFNEEQSDECMTGLLGSQDGNSEKCVISDRCKVFMVNEKAKGYYLTHQILFYSLGKKLGCNSVMENQLATRGLSIKEMERRLCIRVYSQMEMAIKDGESEKDLFLECGAVCSPLGFYEVLPQKWIAAALNWQEESGCYMYKGEESQGEEELVFSL